MSANKTNADLPELYSNIDTADVKVKMSRNGRGIDVVHKSDNNKLFSLLTAPMLLVHPQLQGEGDFAKKYKNEQGNDLGCDNRKDAQFKLGISIGDMGDATLAQACPTLKAEQRACMQKIYDVGKAVLASAFDERVPDFAGKIEECIADFVTVERDYVVRQGTSAATTTDDDVRKLMETDAALNERIMTQARDRFVGRASYFFPNPADFDEDGYSFKRTKDGKAKRLSVYMKRKVWSYRREQTPGQMEQAKKMQLPTEEQLSVTKNTWQVTWPKLLAIVKEHFAWNCVTFIDGATKRELSRELVDGLANPFWSPADPDVVISLVEVRLSYTMWTMNSMYGVKVQPWRTIRIVRQVPKPDDSAAFGNTYDSIATGCVQPAAAEPDAKRPKLADLDAGGQQPQLGQESAVAGTDAEDAPYDD